MRALAVVVVDVDAQNASEVAADRSPSLGGLIPSEPSAAHSPYVTDFTRSESTFGRAFNV
jgi:hypothetical protein